MPQANLYPGFAALQIARIEPDRPRAGTEVQLTVSLEWDHVGIPRMGLPTWLELRVFASDGSELRSPRALVVPDKLDFTSRKAELSRLITFPAAGKYKIVADATHPEVQESQPVEITVE